MFLPLSAQAALADHVFTHLTDAISYSTAASQSARSVENLLQCLIQRLRKLKDTEEESPLPHSYKYLDFEVSLK